MSILITDLAQAREVVNCLLQELKLSNYVFDIEAHEQQWDVTVECETNGGWEVVTLKAEEQYLKHGAEDSVLHEVLLSDWREALNACCKAQYR